MIIFYAQKFTMAGWKIRHSWQKNPLQLEKIPPPLVGQSAMGQRKNPLCLADKSSPFGGNSCSGGNFHSGGIFRAILCDSFPGKFRCTQVVILRHTLSGLELSGILFAVHSLLLAHLIDVLFLAYISSCLNIWLMSSFLLIYPPAYKSSSMTIPN